MRCDLLGYVQRVSWRVCANYFVAELEREFRVQRVRDDGAGDGRDVQGTNHASGLIAVQGATNDVIAWNRDIHT